MDRVVFVTGETRGRVGHGQPEGVADAANILFAPDRH